MDNKTSNRWKSAVKYVLNNFKEKTIQYCNPQSKFKMSEIKNLSTSSNLNLASQKNSIDDNTNKFQKIINEENLNNFNFNNKISIADYYLNDNKSVESTAMGSRLTLASIAYDNSFVQNDLYSNKFEQSTDSFSDHENHDGIKHKQPIMGKTALLKKTNLEHSDSFIVHSIILNKYEDILNHYVNRMYKRRISRMSSMSDDDYSETYTVPRYSPSSKTSSGTHKSIPDFETSYFGNKKCYSIDDINVETPHEPLNDSSLTCWSNLNNGISTSCSEYDPQKFLVNALGDLASIDSGSHDCLSNTGCTCEESVGTSHISSLMSKTNSFCSSLNKKKLRKNCKKSGPQEVSKMGEFSSSDFLEQYKKELSRQQSIIFQVSKALNVCKMSKEFYFGRERLEAEKILLLATITKESLTNEINTIEFDTYRSIYDPRCTGEVAISNITFNLKEKIDDEQLSDNEEYFLVVLTCGKNVLSSSISQAEEELLKVEKTFRFQNLLTDFEIDLYVYSLKINKKHYSQEQFKCPSPKSIFKCNRESKQCKTSNRSKTPEQIAFIPIGRYHIRNSVLSGIQNGNLNLKLEQDPHRCSLKPSFELQIETKFQLTNRLPGFLTVGVNNAKNCLSWNRRWCVLDGFYLKYWNYPSDETSDPLGQIDIRLCTDEKVFPADRSACARPKTLSLSIKDPKGVKRYYLSTDTQSDLQMWESELNFVLTSIIIWKERRD